MDRSEVKLQNSEKNIDISHTRNEILKQKISPEVGLRGCQNFEKLFSRDYF